MPLLGRPIASLMSALLHPRLAPLADRATHGPHAK